MKLIGDLRGPLYTNARNRDGQFGVCIAPPTCNAMKDAVARDQMTRGILLYAYRFIAKKANPFLLSSSSFQVLLVLHELPPASDRWWE